MRWNRGGLRVEKYRRSTGWHLKMGPSGDNRSEQGGRAQPNTIVDSSIFKELPAHWLSDVTGEMGVSEHSCFSVLCDQQNRIVLYKYALAIWALPPENLIQ